VLFPELVEVLDPEPHAAALNMAIDEILLRQMERRPILRIYRWEEPAVSFGYFDRIAEVEGVGAGRALVRRWTGGGIVEHGEDLTYTVAVPREHPFLQHGAPESYRLIHDAIGKLLTGEGTYAEVAPIAGAKISSACFANPVRYDLVAGGRKIAGAAQRRTRWGLLHQGSIRTGAPLPGLGEKLAGVFGAEVSRCRLAPEIVDEARALAESRYGTLAWLRKY
jgi:lipoate-protein ligase A